MGNAPTKHFGRSTKHLGTTTKELAEEMPGTYADFGAYGDYVITTDDGTELPVFKAVTIRVLDHGELNLVTDSGRWFLFAPNAWKRVALAPPKPGEVSFTQ